MSDDEEVAFEASDEDDVDDVISDDDGDQDDETNVEEELKALKWEMTPAKKTRKEKKDIIVSGRKLLFKPTNLIDCFDNFFSLILRKKILKYSNMKGKVRCPR